MKFSFLSLHLLDINILFLLILIKYSAQQDGPDWAKVNDVIYKGPKYVEEGQTFKITCRMSQFNAPKWTFNDKPIGDSNRISYKNGVGVELTRIETITVTNASAIDSGVYRCNSFSRANHRIDVITSQPITSIPESSTHSDTIFEEIKEEFSTVILNCNDLSDSDDTEIQWYKNGIKISNDGRREIQKSTLIIREATSAIDAGDYSCLISSMSLRGGSQFGQIIQLRAPIRIKPFVSPQSVVIGRKHRFECQYTGYPFGKIKWIIGNEVFNERINELNLQIKANEDSHPDSVLIIENITKAHNNSYTCVVDNGYTKDETSAVITVRESAIQTKSPILLAENKPLNLVCNYTDANNQVKSIDWQWLKEGYAYEDLSPETKERVKIDPKDKSLTISKAKKEDVGNWVCQEPSNPDNRATIRVISRPWLEPFHEFQKTNYRSANIVEGQRFHLKCQIIEGYDRDAFINWFKYNESEENNENKILVPLSDEGPAGHIRIEALNMTIQTLTIEKVVPSDRFYYVCVANNNVFNFNNTILLRVKDKLGALWPFLGIVAEVVILCTIIFIYEKRRIKPDFDESDNENNTEPKGTQDRSKPQEVRQRK